MSFQWAECLIKLPESLIKFHQDLTLPFYVLVSNNALLFDTSNVSATNNHVKCPPLLHKDVLKKYNIGQVYLNLSTCIDVF